MHGARPHVTVAAWDFATLVGLARRLKAIDWDEQLRLERERRAAQASASGPRATTRGATSASSSHTAAPTGDDDAVA